MEIPCYMRDPDAYLIEIGQTTMTAGPLDRISELSRLSPLHRRDRAQALILVLSLQYGFLRP